jgi:hypothetical protein
MQGREKMINTIYLNNEPFFCYNPITEKVNCLDGWQDTKEPHDIKYYKPWEKTRGNILPIWFENDCGKQITFLIK